MNNIYISKDANKIVTDYIESKGYQVTPVSSTDVVSEEISSHPDIFLCKMGVHKNSPVFFAEPGTLGKTYPMDIVFNAACTGKYFIHNLSFTNESLLLAAKAMDMILIDVPQGYAKCSTVVVDEDSIITYDEGIIKACSEFPELNVLKIQPGFVKLPGYNTGFLGGATGRIDDEIIFHGDLSSHPNFKEITDFIHERGLTCKWFPEFPLTDIGSIL